MRGMLTLMALAAACAGTTPDGGEQPNMDAGTPGADAGAPDGGAECVADTDCPQDSPRTCSRCDDGTCDTRSPCAAECDAPPRPVGAASPGCEPDHYRQAETAPIVPWSVPAADTCLPVCECEVRDDCALPACWSSECPGILGGEWECEDVFFYTAGGAAHRILEIVTAPWCDRSVLAFRHAGAPGRWIVRPWPTSTLSPCDRWYAESTDEWPFTFSDASAG